MSAKSADYARGVRDERTRTLAILRRLREDAFRKWQGGGTVRGTHATYEEALVDAFDTALVSITLVKPCPPKQSRRRESGNSSAPRSFG